MKLSDILHRECIAVKASVADKEDALRQAARLARRCPLLEKVSEERIFEGFRQREEHGSTGFGKGVAIPHCRLAEVSDFVIGAISVPGGVEFKALDREKVRLIAFIVGPESDTADHLRALSALSLLIGGEDRIREIAASNTPEEMYKTLLEETRRDPDLRGHTDKRLFQVFVQDDNLVAGLISAFESLDQSSVAVVDAGNAGQYLARIPMFTGLFTDGHSQHCKIVLSVISKEMTNEAVRRIEAVTGHLDQRSDVLVTVQDLFYSAGALQV
jgi:PTS system nitrogen regulatory IIA component